MKIWKKKKIFQEKGFGLKNVIDVNINENVGDLQFIINGFIDLKILIL